MKTASALCCLLLVGCASPPPFGATWYLVQPTLLPAGIEPPPMPFGPPASVQSSGTLQIALLNHGAANCVIEAIELNGAEDANKDRRGASVWKDISIQFPVGRVLVVPIDNSFEPPLPSCTVPVRVVVKVRDLACKSSDRFGRKDDPVIELRNGFPNYLPLSWDVDCGGVAPRTAGN